MKKPEEQAREHIDAALEAAGWSLRDASKANPDVIAAEIVEDLRAALEQFEAVLADLPSSVADEPAA